MMQPATATRLEPNPRTTSDPAGETFSKMGETTYGEPPPYFGAALEDAERLLKYQREQQRAA